MSASRVQTSCARPAPDPRGDPRAPMDGLAVQRPELTACPEGQGGPGEAQRCGGASWCRARGHAVWSPTAWTPAQGEVQSSRRSRDPEAGLRAQAAPPGTCHQLKAPRQDCNGAASAEPRPVTAVLTPHPETSLRRDETASGRRPGPSGPAAPALCPGGSRASAP